MAGIDVVLAMLLTTACEEEKHRNAKA